MDLEYLTSNFDRAWGNLPRMPLLNMYVEQAPTEDKPVLQSRPGLGLTGTEGSGPIRAMYYNDGVDGAMYTISGSNAYRAGVNLGAIAGSGTARIDGNVGSSNNWVFFTKGTTLYKWDGATFSTVATPGGFNTRDLCVGASRLIVVDDNTGKFYWSDPLTATIGALNFATAENSPDLLKACRYIGDTLILFGSKTIEFWPVTTDPDNPFQPLQGRTFQCGLRETNCVTQCDDGFAWITDKNRVCINQPDQVISEDWLEALIQADSAPVLWRFRLEGKEFLAVRLAGATYVYNTRSRTWSWFMTYGASNWVPQCFCDINAVTGYFGSSVNGDLMAWRTDCQDYGATGSVLERSFRCGQILKADTVAVSNLQIRTNTGVTPIGVEPVPGVAMVYSRDGGATFSAPILRDLQNSTTGKPRTLIQWRSLGRFGFPGILIQFYVLSKSLWRVSGVTINEPYANIGNP
jgi:hypothetical protein